MNFSDKLCTNRGGRKRGCGREGRMKEDGRQEEREDRRRKGREERRREGVRKRVRKEKIAGREGDN